jgi:hypothetical protein
VTSTLVGRSAPSRRLRSPLAVAGIVTAAVGVLVVVDPNEPGHYPGCVLKNVTGLDCPACGGLRCVRALATGHPVEAADHNLLAVLVLPVFVLGWLAWMRRSWQGRPLVGTAGPHPVIPAGVIGWTFGLALVAFMVVRNLPGVPFLGSGLG